MRKNAIFAICQGKLLMTGVFLMLFCTFNFAQSNPNLGDVNADGFIDVIDALLIAQYYVGMDVDLPAIENADVNADNAIDIIDALLVAQYYVGLIDSLPGNPTVVPTPGPTGTPTLSPEDPTPEPTPVPTPTISPPPGGPPEPSREISYNEDITMTYGETVRITGYELTFTFGDVNDSRCPRDLTCVWEGEAVVTLYCWAGPQYAGTLEIKAPPAEPDNGWVGRPGYYYYEIACKAVDPYPIADFTTPKEEYTVNLNCGLILP